MSKIRVGIIGCGAIAHAAHIPAYLKCEDAEIVYFCDIIKERAEECVEKYGVGQAVTDYKVIAQDETIDAVSVCTPNNMHSIISIDMLRAGKHVLCEKPAARTYAEALEMQKVQQETNKVLNIGVVNRFNASVNEIRDLINSGKLGEVYHVYVSFRAFRSIPGLGGDFTNKAVAGGGALIDWGVHYLDIVMYCLNDPKPETVSGQAYSKLGVNMKEYKYESMWAGPPNYDGVYDVDDFVTAFVRTEGPTISLNGAWAQNIREQDTYIDFLGDKAGIRLQYGGDFKLYYIEDDEFKVASSTREPVNHFDAEIRAFLDCIKSGEKLPSHIDYAILTSQIMQGIYDSSDQRREVSFDK